MNPSPHSHQRLLWMFALLAALWLFYLFSSGEDKIASSPTQEIPQTQKNLPLEAPTGQPSSNLTSPAQSERSSPHRQPAQTKTNRERVAHALQSFLSELPTIAQEREEVKANLHAPPASLLVMAENMAPIMEAALENETVARQVLAKLGECAHLGQNFSNPVKGFCVVNARRLVKRWPSLDPHWAPYRANLDDKLAHFMEITDKIR